MNKIKSKVLTKLFMEWVKEETDPELLEISKTMIQNRQDIINNRITVIGFQYNKQ